MPTRKAAPALAAGCTMVLKPAEQTPLTALAVMKLGEEAGLPPGVLSIVLGDAQDAPAIGREMTSNPLVRKLGFTGSTEVGKLLMAQCAGQIKKVSLELGGNAPFIVFDDADLDAAVDGAVTCKFRNSGQTCISANRIMVQAGVYDDFVARFTERAAALTVADGFNDPVDVGPLIDEPAIEKVVRHVDDARSRGAEVLLEGGRDDLGPQFFRPTVLAGITDEMAMSNEETFGPVAGFSRFATEGEAVRKANDTPYGLSAYYYSRDVGRIWRVSEALEYGILGINTGVISTEVAPFGGVKESGIGREGSKYGIDEWLEVKYLCLGGIA
jgi:succinate-semialdehyde dehydrogenase/glutarate-semialdehyde dehydrogenase